MKTFFLLPVVLLLSHAGHLFAGSVITTNLPADTVIVNINAQADGVANYSGDAYQSFFYQPTTTAPSRPAPTASASLTRPTLRKPFLP